MFVKTIHKVQGVLSLLFDHGLLVLSFIVEHISVHFVRTGQVLIAELCHAFCGYVVHMAIVLRL